MAADLLEGGGSAEGRNNDFNVLATIKRALAKIFLDGVDFSSPFLKPYVRRGIALGPRRTPSNTPHPTSLRSATALGLFGPSFGPHRGRRGSFARTPLQVSNVRDLRRR